MEKITLSTQDGVRLSALWWDSAAGESALLLHMMPATKESWQDLAGQLASRGLNVLAIDFRGHGESGGGDFRKFSPQQHQEYYTDAAAAAGFLLENYPGGKMYLGGASIGANISIKFMSEHPEIEKGFALSAGLDYYGVKAGEDIGRLSPAQQILLAGSFDDVRSSGNCGEMAEQLYAAASARKEKIIFETGGHGTDMFAAHPRLMDQIAGFLAA